MVTYGELYRRVRTALESEEGPRAAFTARELLSFVSGHTPAALMGMQTIYASEDTARRYMELAGRVLAGEPLAYILGRWSFYGLDLTVTPDVLIPRDDTMAVVDLALANSCPVSTELKRRYQKEDAEPLELDAARVADLGIELVTRPLISDTSEYARHCPVRLAQAIMELYEERAEIRVFT